MTFNGIHKFHTNYDSYTYKQNEVFIDKLNYLGFAILDLSKSLMYETIYDKLQPYFGRKNLQLHYMDCDSFVLSIETQNIFIDFEKSWTFIWFQQFEWKWWTIQNEKQNNLLVKLKFKLLKIFG